MSSSSTLARVSDSTKRLDALVNDMMAREAQRLEAEQAEQARADAAQAKADALKRVEIAERYDEAFRSFGERVPMPTADERPGAFRKRLFENLRRRLPEDHEWASVRADDIPASARAQIEAMVIKAAKVEAERPSVENLPRDGALLRRDLVDPMSGQRSIEWHGRESFIKQMGNPLKQRVVRFLDRKTNAVIMGAPMPRIG